MFLFHMDDDTHLIAEAKDGNDPLRVQLAQSGVVRYWGTTKGRGELAIDGPTGKTIFDIEPVGGVVNWLHVRRVIAVTEKARAKWAVLLSGKK